MHPKEDVFISTSNEFETRLWNLNNRNCLLKIIDSVCAAFNPNGKVFASVTEKFSEGTNKNELSYVNIYMYPNIREGPVFATKLEHKGNLLHIMFSHDELWLCIEDVEENVYVLNTIDFSCILKLQNINLSQKETPYRFHISPCSNFIAMPYISGDLLIWNLLSGKVENTLNSNKNKMNLVKFCPFSRKVITTTNKGEIIIWTVN